MGQLHSASSVVVVLEPSSRRCSQCAITFGISIGRHHCRSCGDMVCGICSPFTEFLPQLGYPADVEQRVCSCCAGKSHGTILHEKAVHAFLMAHLDHRAELDRNSLYDVEDLLNRAMLLPTFNPYLLDRLRLQFACTFAHTYSSVLSNLDAALRSPYVSNSQIRSYIVSCERVRDVYLNHASDIEPVDIQLLSDQIEWAKSRASGNDPSSLIEKTPLRPCIAERKPSGAQRKRVRFLPIDAPELAQIEMDHIASSSLFTNDVVCQ